MQHVERHAERVYVGVVAVVDYRRRGDSLLHFEAHGHVDLCRCSVERISQTAAQRCRQTRVYGERFTALVQPVELLVSGVDQLAVGIGLGDAPGQILVTSVIYYGLRALHKDELLVDLLPAAGKVRRVGVAYRREHCYLRAYHSLQTLHFSRMRYARLDVGDLLVALDHQQRQRHA